MLRLGQIVGSDRIAPEITFGHWRQIQTPKGTGWINLKPPQISVYSDADFPH